MEIEFRGTKGTLYLFSDGYEIVPDEITPNEFPARTPLDRRVRARLPHGREADHRAGEGDRRPRRHERPRAQLPRLRPQPGGLRVRHRDRPSEHVGHAHRQHRAQDAIVPGVGREAERFTNSTEANALLSYGIGRRT